MPVFLLFYVVCLINEGLSVSLSLTRIHTHYETTAHILFVPENKYVCTCKLAQILAYRISGLP